MNKLCNILSKSMGFIYAYMKRITKKKTSVHNNKVLIIATGHIGNAIIDSPAIYDMIVYLKKQRKDIYFLCSKMMWEMFTLLIDTSNVEFIESDYHYKSNGTDFRSVRNILGILKGYAFETVIVTLPAIDPLAHYIVATLHVNESWGVFDNIKHTRGLARYFFERYYTNKIMVPIDMQETQRLKLLLRKLGCTSHSTTIKFIPEQMKLPISNPYITIAVDSASTERRWSVEQFVKLANLLLDIYPYDVYLTGSNVSEINMEQYAVTFNENTRVKNYINKTDLKEWIEMIRYSQFHVGVDSGSVHVAASVGTRVFCLTGVWDGRRVMPYQVDKKDEKTIEPICIYRNDVEVNQLDCYACKVYGGRFGTGNSVCYRECRKGNPCQCLQKIEAEDVCAIIHAHIGT